MANLIFRRPDREHLTPEHVPDGYRGKVSGSARSLEEAAEITRRHDRSADGGPRLQPLVVTDRQTNETAEREMHDRAGVDGERLIAERKRRR